MLKKGFLIILTIIFSAIILSLTIRGISGNPSVSNLNSENWKEKGPLELSPDRGRFALTFSLVEDKSVEFSLPIARFVTPDLGYINGKYVSLFAPGVSFLVTPGYIIGKNLGISQVGSFAVISLFAILNVLLLRSIAIKLGANKIASTIGAFTFIFASPAFAYAVTLYQHHISTFLILLSIYSFLKWKNFWGLSLIWFLAAASIPIDYPNFFLMLPIGILALGRIILLKTKKDSFNIKINLLQSLSLFAILFPLLFFIWFNKISYGNPLQFSGTIPSVKAIDSQGNPAAPKESTQEEIERRINPEIQEKSSVKFFNPRNMINGLYIHSVSLDRGVLIYTPVMLFGILGISFLYKKNKKMSALFLSIIGSNVILYSMWGDPWGGWAFGSRYLIPSYSIMAVFISLALTKHRKNNLLITFFVIVFGYSVAVNTLGAITTNSNPPKIEATSLSKISGHYENYTYIRNFEFLKINGSKSFFYQEVARNLINAEVYYFLITAIIISPTFALLIYLRFNKERE